MREETSIIIGEKEYFKGIDTIRYEGRESQNPLTFRYYDENEVVGTKSMKDRLWFAKPDRTI